MTIEHLAPELRQGIGRMPRIRIGSGINRWLIRTAMKVVFREKQFAGVKIEKRTIAHGVNIRIYTPESGATGAALLWIHGGGLVIGSARQDDAFCVETARELGLVVVSADYRLAPDFPFPAALDDCYATCEWLQKSAPELNIDPSRVAVGGQSAGGGLAASTVQRIHDAGGVQPAAQWLFCPMLDDRTAARHELDAIAHFIWGNRENKIGWRAYLGTEPGADHVPDYAVPARRRDLNGLPQAWIGMGDIELFFDEDSAYAERLRADGVDCTVDIVPGAAHGFEAIASKTDMAQAYLSRARVWLGQKLAPVPVA